MFLSVLVAFALSACGGGGGAKSTQVAVKVNRDEITVLQVNEQLGRLPPGIPADQREPATRKIVDGLVNQQLLAQQALERKLDRDPAVLGALEAARLNILAQAYVQRVIAPQAKPTEQEIKQYYVDNPALFSERKVYRLQELAIEANAEQQQAIEAAASGKSLKQLADFLRDKKIPFNADNGVRTAEQLPLGQLSKISQLKSGSVLVFASGPTRLSAIEVLAFESQPVDEKKATPVIEQYLTNRKREQLAEGEVKRLHDAAKIEYVGDFAKYAAAASPEPPAGTATRAPDSAPAAPPPAAAGKPASGEQAKGIAALH